MAGLRPGHSRQRAVTMPSADSELLKRPYERFKARDMAARGEDLAQGFQIAEEAAKEFSQDVLHAKAAALQAGGHRVGIRPAKDAEIAKFGAEDTLARDGGDRPDYGFNFGKFRHRAILSRSKLLACSFSGQASSLPHGPFL